MLKVHYYDGMINRSHEAELLPHPSGVILRYQGHEKLYAYHEMAFIGAIGNIHPVIELANDARIEFLSNDVPKWLEFKNKALSEQVHKIEGSWRWITVSFVVMLVVIFTTFKWGIPAAAHYVAMQLPDQTLNKLGREAQAFVIAQTKDSQLTAQRQQQITQLYQDNIQTKNPAKIIFRQGGDWIGANALAIPNGTIILTDELVELAKHDYEILGVLAHEQGHLDDKHSLQQALRNVGITILYVSVTGDASDIIGGLPVAIVASKYSQKFELEADQRAIDELKRQNISPQYMADFLQRLSQSNGAEEGSDFLASHPATTKRIEQIQGQIAQ